MFGALAMITPPVCVAAFTAAAIAGAGPMKTGLTASRLGFAGYVVPFLFVLNPAILLQETTVITALVAIIAAVIALMGIAAGFEGYLLRKTSAWERGLLLAGGISLLAFEYFSGQGIVSSQWLTGSIGIGAMLLALVIIFRYL
jgi:TRAP-type uncharacterized transport system fused permease subunit